MKKQIITLLAAIALPLFVSAQKIGHVNLTELIQQMPEYKEVGVKMDTLNAQFEREYMKMAEEFRAKYTEYQQNAATMPETIRAAREEELQGMSNRIDVFRQTSSQDMQKQEQALTTPIYEKVQKAVNEVGAENGYTYIINYNPMIFTAQPALATLMYVAADANDVSALVKAKLGIK